MGELVARPANAVNDKIIALADSHSPEEISKILGGVISPAKIAAHTQTLLSSKSWLTIAQQDQLITLKMQKLLLQLEDQARDKDNVGMQIKLLKEIGVRLDKRSKATDADLSTLYANQGKIMGQVYDHALSFIKGAIRDTIDPQLWDELTAEALIHAQAELAKYEVEA